MSTEPSELVVKERATTMASIEAAFAGVTRGETAISWNECVAHDNYQSDAACMAARRSDTDSHWSQLVDEPEWCPFPGIGGFAFINTEGFQYYLPPTMIRLLRGENEELFPGHLLSSIERFTDDIQFSLWSRDQLVAIAGFIAFMARHDPEVEDSNPWEEALERRWSTFLT